MSAEKKHLPTAKEVVERYIEVSGGKEKIKAVRSLRMEGIGAIPGVNYFEEVSLYQPGRTCLITKLPNGWVSKIIYNNGRAIEIINGESNLVTDSLRLERMKLNGKLLNDISYFDDGYQLSFVNTEKLNGRVHYRIKVTSPLGATDYKLYDAETGLLTFVADADGYKTTYGGYETVDGFNFPMTIQMIDRTGSVLNLQTSKITFNKSIDPKLFELK